MKKFVTKILILSIYLFLFLLSTFILVKYYSNFKVDDKNNILLVGHSHTECAFNDSLIMGLSNFSASGESYFYTFFKVKKIIEQNPQFDTIFVEFTNNQIDQHMDEWIWGEKFMSHHFPKWAVFMNFETYNLLFDKNPECFKKSLLPIIRNNLDIIFNGLNYSGDIGGYRYLVRDKTDSLLTALEIISKPIKKKPRISETNIEYLIKLVSFCNEKKIKVFFVRSPVHNKSTGFNNELIFKDLLATKFKDIEFLDFAKYPLKNSEFGDLEHLNFKGAKLFSNWVNELMLNDLLKKTNKQYFIDQRIASLNDELTHN